ACAWGGTPSPAASAVPSLGTWLRLVAGSLAIVILVGPPALGNTKDPRRPGEGPEVDRWWSSLAALVPPCPSVPPGAGNQPKKAAKPRKRQEKVEEGYVRRRRIDRDVQAPAIRRDDDGDLAACARFEPAQSGLQVWWPQRTCS